jgi:hypothetical protein
MVHRLPRGKTPRPPVVSVGATTTSLPLANPAWDKVGQGGKGASGGKDQAGWPMDWPPRPDRGDHARPNLDKSRIAETTLDLNQTNQSPSPIAVRNGGGHDGP